MTSATAKRLSEPSEPLYRSLCALAPLGIFHADGEGRTTYTNPRWQAMSGLTAEESLEDGWSRAVHPDDRNAVLDAWANAIREGGAFCCEYRMLTPQRVVRWVLCRATAIFSDEGTPTGYVGMVEDITERRRTEEALRESEERLRFALRAAHMTAWDWDLLSGRLMRSEGQPGQFWTNTRPEDEFLPSVHPEDRPMVDSAVARALSGEAPYDVEFRLVRPNGQIRWARDRARVTFDESGRPVRMAGIGVDITEHKRSVAALHAGEKRFRAMVEKSWDGAALIAPDGVVRYASPAVPRLLGYTSDELSAPQIFERVHPDDLPRITDLFSQLAHQPGASVTCEYRNADRDSSWHWIEATCTNLLADPDLQAIAANFRDITERKRAEVRLQEFAQQLELRNRELQEFAYVASHDLQEPLRKIEAFGDRLKLRCSEQLTPDGRDYLERMQAAAGRMRTLIEDLLAFSRVTTTAVPFRSVDLSVIAREVLCDLETRIEQTGGTVALGDLPTMDADPTQMRQLLQNLIGNALKFARADQPPAVTVECTLVDPEPAGPGTGRRGSQAGRSPTGRLCRILVRDNGIGFDPKYVDRIFNPFQRLHGRGEYEGTGIGLAICRKIAERHGGHITADSQPGHGSTFIVTLPARQPAGEASSE